MSNRDVAPRLRALDERVKELEAGAMSEVKRWYVDEWGDCREANDGPFVKYSDYTALAERLNNVTKFAVELLSSGMCETHSAKCREMSFDAFRQEIEGKCLQCLAERLKACEEKCVRLAGQTHDWWCETCQQRWNIPMEPNAPCSVPTCETCGFWMCNFLEHERDQLTADLERARAEVERLMWEVMEYASAKRDFDARRLEDDSEWPIRLKRLIRAEQTLIAQAALKETP